MISDCLDGQVDLILTKSISRFARNTVDTVTTIRKLKEHGVEVYFEEQNIERFVEKLERLYPDIQYVNRLMTHSWGQKVVRFYDLDGNLIEVGTPM